MVWQIVLQCWRAKTWGQGSATAVDPRSTTSANAEPRWIQLLGHFHMQNVSSVVRWGICQGRVRIIPRDCMLKVGAANFVALWSTSRKTAQRSRMQVSCRECGVGVDPAGSSYCSAWLWPGERLWEENLEAAEGTFCWDNQGGCGGGSKLQCKTKIIFFLKNVHLLCIWRLYEIIRIFFCAAVHSLAAVQQNWLLLFADFSVKGGAEPQCQVQAGVRHPGQGLRRPVQLDSQLMNYFLTCSSAVHLGGKIKLDSPNPPCAAGGKASNKGLKNDPVTGVGAHLCIFLLSFYDT
ncbi:hypothetical protein Nmel_007817 [Mimus melanotis]